jgi:tellurite resistance protein TehA-like permease
VFVSLAFWLVGAMLYIWLIALIFYRCLFLPLSPGDLAPPYWINMGAMAISALAGISLVRNAALLPFLTEILPFVKGLTLLFWATATWWIPMLLALGFWRHLRRRYPLRYDHGYWAAVFPLGMYTVCTQGLRRELGLVFLEMIPTIFVWIALGAWIATAVALAFHLIKKRPDRSTPT